MKADDAVGRTPRNLELAGEGLAPGPLLSLAIVPASQSVAAAGQTTQFMAIGDFSSSSSTPGNQNMANVSGYSVKWGSSNTQVATIDPNTGIATGVGQGATAITVVVTNNTDKTGATATATFTVTGPSTSTISALSIIPGSQAVTLPTIDRPFRPLVLSPSAPIAAQALR